MLRWIYYFVGRGLMWFVSIRPGYLVFRPNDHCMIESYMPSSFVR